MSAGTISLCHQTEVKPFEWSASEHLRESSLSRERSVFFSKRQLSLFAPKSLKSGDTIRYNSDAYSGIWLPSENMMRDERFVAKDKISNRLINHAKDADFSVYKIPIKDIIPENLSVLLIKEKTSKLILSSVMRKEPTITTRFISGMSRQPELGVTLQMLIDLTSVKPDGITFETKKLVDEVFVEYTSETKCAMVECLKGSKDSIGQPAVGKMNFFISYSWRYKMKDLIDAIRQFEAKRKSKEPIYYFIDCICINQWNPTSALSNLASTISASEGVVLILKPWNAPGPLKRAWCLLEISMALHLEHVPLYIEMPKEEVTSFHKAIVNSFDDVTKELSNIDVRHADATVKTDLEMIRSHIKNTVGYTVLNQMIISSLGKWLAKVGAQILDRDFEVKLAREERLLGFERLAILARFERHLGHPENALKFYKKAWKGLDNELGHNDKKTIVAKSNFGNQLREMGKFVEAENVLADCLKTAAEYFTKHDPVYLIIMNNYGLLKKNTGDLVEAESILRECQIEGLYSEVDGAKPWDNLTRLSNLALVFSAQGNYEKALKIFENCLANDKDVIGPRNPYTLIDIMNLGAVLWRLGEVRKCEEMLRFGYENCVEVVGLNHIITQMTLWWWTIALVKLGNMPKARANIRKLEKMLKNVYRKGDERMDKLMALKKAITVD